jgi:pimeloyl-ACP methyl ester carboxylesterase
MKWGNVGRNVGLGAIAAAAGLAGYSHWQGRRAEAAVPRDGTLVEVEGARLHYLDEGSGPAIVLIHGLGGQLRNFSYALSGRLSGYRVVLVDRPGSGYSVATGATRPGIVEQGAVMARFIAALGLDRPLVVGHSLGGAVALALALDRPDLVRGLALIAPLTQAETAVPEAFRAIAQPSAVGRTLVANLLGVPLGQLAGERTTRKVFAPEPIVPDFATKGGGKLALRPGNLDASMRDLLGAEADMPGLVARYGELTLPVSILYGHQDAILDPDRHGTLTAGQIAGAHLERVAGGHMLPLTQPDLTATFLRDADRRISRPG